MLLNAVNLHIYELSCLTKKVVILFSNTDIPARYYCSNDPERSSGFLWALLLSLLVTCLTAEPRHLPRIQWWPSNRLQGLQIVLHWYLSISVLILSICPSTCTRANVLLLKPITSSPQTVTAALTERGAGGRCMRTRVLWVGCYVLKINASKDNDKIVK